MNDAEGTGRVDEQMLDDPAPLSLTWQAADEELASALPVSLPALRRHAIRRDGVVLLCITALAFGARGFALSVSAIDWDEGVYLVMAQQWLHGGLPYLAVWDQHPPGLPALLALVQAVLPAPVLGARLAASLAVSITAGLLYLFCARATGRWAAALAGALLYVLCISRFGGLDANTEVFNNALVIGAAWLLFAAARPACRGGAAFGRAVLAALLLGLGLQIKYVILPEAMLLCLGMLAAWLAQGRGRARVLAAAFCLVVAGCLPSAVAVLWFWWHGALAAFLAANVSSNLTYVTMLPSLDAVELYAMSGLAPLAGAFLVVGYSLARLDPARMRRRAAGPSAARWVALWSLAAAIDVCLPMKFYPHYFFALYPPVCAAAGLALAGLPGRRRGRAMAMALLCIIALPLWIAGVARSTRMAGHDVPRAFARLLRERGAADMDVFVYDDQPVIYALAHVRPPTPYVIKAEFTDFSRSADIDGAAEVNRVMDRQPRFVIAHVGCASGQVDALDRLMARRLAFYHPIAAFQEDGSCPAVLQER